MHVLLPAFREFRARPGVGLVAVCTLALGIAGATTMFTLMSAAGASMVPPGVNDRLVGRIVWTSLDESGARAPLTAGEYVELGRATGFEWLSASSDASMVLGQDGPTVSVKHVSPSFLRTFRFEVNAGRVFAAADCQASAARVAIVAQAFVVRFPEYGLGKRVALDGAEYTIVGILPDRHWYPAPGGPDVWLPLPSSADGTPLADAITVTARLASAAHLRNAQAQLDVIAERWPQRPPDGRRRKLRFITLAEEMHRRRGFGLAGLLGPSLVVLLIACANVANLLLARGASREREMAVRAALGASRRRLLRERLAEAAWPAAAGGAVGMALAFGAVRALRWWIGSIPEARAAAEAIRLDPVALLFAVALTAAVPIASGLVPALAASRPDLQAVLHQASGRRRPGRGPYSGRDLLVIVEIGLAVVLVVCAGMFTSFFRELGHVSWGFDPTRVLIVPLSSSHDTGRPGVNAPLVEDVLRAVRAVPGVQRAAAGGVPGLEPSWRAGRIEFEDCAAPSSATATAVVVDGDYFASLGLRIHRGRSITTADRTASSPVGVISLRHAERCWPGEDPLGRRFRFPGRGPGAWATVVGVAADAITTRAIETTQPVYLARTPGDAVPPAILVRVDGEPGRIVAPLRAAIRSVDPSQRAAVIGRFDEAWNRRFQGTPLIAGITGAFGALALLLGALGIFSVTSHAVAERTPEFGIRLALGASRREVMALVIRQSGALVVIGSLVAAIGTLAVTRVSFPELARVASRDPLLWLCVGALLALVALGGSAVPARRAMQVEPVVALRAE